MRRSLVRVAAAGAVICLSLVAGCSSVQDSGRTSIVYASDEQTAIVTVVTGSVRDAAAKQNADLSTLDNHIDAAKVVDNANTAATRKPSVFIEYSSVADANSRVDKILKQSGVPIVAVQYPVGDAPLFAIDNTQVGALGGAAVADAAIAKWGAGTPVQALLLTLPAGGQLQVERSGAAEKAIKDKLSKVTSTVGDTKLDANVTRQVTADFLSAHPGEKVVIWSHLDSMALAAVAAVKAANRTDDVLVVGTSGDKAVFAELRTATSPFIGTVGLFPENWGPEIVALALKVAAHQPVPAITHPSRTEVITKDNLDSIYPQS
ncbi:MAG: ribose transport system substrate-binding protein [Pseudonocardiales bacterium]|jgi:ribose transport system substrate-binding protein|nr:ribose transport system substrate-binding protein [Pseudonocardiales bacterium]